MLERNLELILHLHIWFVPKEHLRLNLFRNKEEIAKTDHRIGKPSVPREVYLILRKLNILLYSNNLVSKNVDAFYTLNCSLFLILLKV